MNEYTAGRPGFSKLFHIETLRRIPVEQDQHTQNLIGASTYEGRIFPQALSDEFGKFIQVERIVLQAVLKKDHFSVTEKEHDLLLQIDICSNNALLHRFLLNMADLQHIHRSGWHSFQAGETAQELARIFQQVKGQ